MGRPARAAALSARDDLSDVRVRLGPSDEIVAAAEIVDVGGSEWTATEPVVAEGADAELAPLVDELLERARARGAPALGVRVAVERAELASVLLAAGFEEVERRACYRAAVAELPEGDDGLAWVSMAEAGRAAAEALFAEIVATDPWWDEPEPPAAVLAAWLRDPILQCDDDVVHLGVRDGRAVAFVSAQVNPRSGWGRITYLGLRAELRGQGLGAVVHRHGFAMLRARGGVTYEGGTAVDNAPMRRLFEQHGCDCLRIEVGYRWTPG
ncbi:MAG: GNAT family N-acetyltransferase [Alphaproteobacteria bacterium]|nr:GNAT family N-acetyltransferase [Alphaproteobacteria bacterium]